MSSLSSPQGQEAEEAVLKMTKMTYDKNKFQKLRIQNVIIRMMKSEMWKIENRKREKHLLKFSWCVLGKKLNHLVQLLLMGTKNVDYD